MKNVHRIGDVDDAGAAITGSLQSTLIVNGIAVAVNGSPVQPHIPTPSGYAHVGIKTANGAPNFFIANIPTNRLGDADTCGHRRVAGSPNFFVG
jgi:uncharacterized Zn-binding protein involved in type VI secretion